MGTLRKLKTKMMLDPNRSKSLLRSPGTEILIDLDGDREADIAILDTTGNGDIDFLAVDMTGDGEFNLYIGDTDKNGVPRMIIYDENGNECPEFSAVGKAPEEGLITAASLVRSAVITGDYISDTLEEKLACLGRQIKRAQNGSKNKKRSAYNL